MKLWKYKIIEYEVKKMNTQELYIKLIASYYSI